MGGKYGNVRGLWEGNLTGVTSVEHREAAMIQELISTLTAAGLAVQFNSYDDSDKVSASILAPELEFPRGAATAKTPERALVLASARGLASIYHRVKGGVLSLEEKV